MTPRKPHNFTDLAGLTFGRMTVVERLANNPDGKSMWRCRCACGNEKAVSGKALRDGKSESCGCEIAALKKPVPFVADEIDNDLSEVNWFLNNGYLRGRLNGKVVYLHRVIALRMGIDSRVVDHINGDKLDNRRSNLRKASTAQNNRNQKGHCDRLYSSFKGVTKGKHGVWRAQCQIKIRDNRSLVQQAHRKVRGLQSGNR